MKKITARLFRVAVVSVLAAMPVMAQAGVAVIAHPSLRVDALTQDNVRQLFLGRMKTLSDGSSPTLIDLDSSVPVRAVFLSEVMGKTEQQIRGYWVRLIFTGKAQPPKVMTSTADVLRAVSSTPGYIGYVDSADAARANVKVLYKAD